MSDNKKRILVCIDWYEPGFKAGGPIRSVANMVNALKHEYEFYILTSVYDLGETEPYPNVPQNQWHDRDGVLVKYMNREALTMASVRTNILEIKPDILYLNSLFSKLFTIAPVFVANRRRIKVVLAPRGMLGQGALDIKKGKKRFFLSIVKFFRFFRNVTWHASTVEEEKEVKQVFGKNARVFIAQNIPITQNKKLDEILNLKDTGTCRFVFLSRITTKKNLNLAIEAAKKLNNRMPVLFDIYGNIEDQEYYDSFSSEIRDHGNVKISYKGVLKPVDVPELLTRSDYMVLPTQHENYGHAIVEAWANGCPVIISKNTPWKNLRHKELGWDVDITNIQNLVDAMQEGIDMDFTSYLAMVRAGYQFFAEQISDESVIQANKQLFEQ